MDILPLFPLKLVVFPEENLNLHVFEPRYKQLINEAHSSGISFGIPCFINGEVQEFGTEVKLDQIKKLYPKGEMDISTIGIRVFKIREFFNQAPNRLYAGGEIERMAEREVPVDPLLTRELLVKVADLYQALSIRRPAPTDPDEFTAFRYAHHIGLSLEQEYNLLRIDNELGRQEFLLEHLNSLIPIASEMEELRRKVQMNGHFKNVIPPKFGQQK